ncbi:hypothetical protein NQ314_015393 [Rhamnusium bicolor]|uniref:CCHC-type domain-containing protein n=1 Tax=Rhamnusium bicolor TaxID=1586634 RepID=A0AAV8WZK4_9CUCU|nr:hypothetical protein NQ314_015393 [Rhamnusium bicolor]
MKDFEEVRRDQIAKYRAVFQTVVDKMRLIDDSLANRLDDRPQEVQNDVGGTTDDFRPALKCPKCGSDMVLRQKKNGPGKYLTCVGYPNCKNTVWFTASVENVEVLNENCQNCGPDVKKLRIKFKQNPFPGYPNPNIFCIGGCDLDVLEALDINISTVRRGNIASRTSQDNIPNNNLNGTVQNNLNNFVNITRNNQQNGRNGGFNNTVKTIRPNNSSGNQTINSNRISHDATRMSNSTRSSLDMMPGPSRITNNSSANSNQHDEIVCACNNKALLLTVRKDGPNKDDGNGNNDDWGGGGGGGRRGRGGGNTSWRGNNSNWKGKATRGRGYTTTQNKTQTRAKRKCGICGEEGHIRTKCPNS